MRKIIFTLKLFMILVLLCQGTGIYGQTFKVDNKKDQLKEIKPNSTYYSTGAKTNLLNENKENTFVEIGRFTGLSTGTAPIVSGASCSYYQTIYFKDEINVANKRIKSIYYYVEGKENWSETVEVYMTHTDSTRLRSYVPVQDLTRVFAGEIATGSPTGWLKIELTHPFEYNNSSNILIAVVDNQNNNDPPLSSFFWQTATGEGNSGPLLSHGTGASGPITAENPYFEGYPLPYRPDIKLELETVPEKPMLLYLPERIDVPYYYDFGEVATQSENIHNIKVKNIGNASVTITGADFASNASEFTYQGGSLTIKAGEIAEIPVKYIPAERGDYLVNMTLTTDVACEGDIVFPLRTTVYKRGYLYEGWEMKPEEFPGPYWSVKGIETNFEIYANWYVNINNYTDSYCYDRYGLLQAYASSFYDTLITPALDITNGDSLTFYAYGNYGGTDRLPLVYSEDKINWQPLELVTLKAWDLSSDDPSAKWSRYSIKLNNITGKKYIGFVTDNCIAHIDKIEGPKLFSFENDLSLMNVEGPVGLTVGKDNNFKVRVANRGNATETDYVVKMMQVGNPAVELARVSGSELKYMEETDVIVNWIPAERDEFEVYFELELAVDNDLSNNTSKTSNITVYSNTSVEKTIEDGIDESTFWYPLNFNYQVNLSQGIYYADELQVGKCKINEMHLYADIDGNVPDQKIRVWIGETDKESLVDGMISANDLTLVYSSDSVDFTPGEYLMRIPFDKPFQYNGKNLVFMIHKEMASSWYSPKSMFKTSVNPKYKNRSVSFWDRDVEVDPYNPPAGDLYWNEEETVYSQRYWDYYTDATFFFDVDGLGEIKGSVSLGDGTLVENVDIKTDNSYFDAVSDTEGNYSFPHLNAGPTSFTATKFGFNDVQATATVYPNFYQILDITLTERDKYLVSGKVLDYNNTPVVNAGIKISGYDNYEVQTDANGEFSFNMWTDNTYDLQIEKYGFENYNSKVSVEGSVINLGNIILTEIPAFPEMVKAEIEGDNVELNWSKPMPALVKEFKYDSGIPDGRVGYNGSDKGVLGTAFKNEALLTEVSFYIDEAKDTDDLFVYVLGLNSIGQPDKSAILHKSERIKVTKNAWNTYSLDLAVYAENGFYVGLNSEGFLAVGLSENTDANPFRLETHYFTFNMEDSVFMGDFRPAEYDKTEKNLMIRATAYDYGKVEYEYGKSSVFDYSNSNASILKSEDLTVETEMTEPVYNYKSGNSKTLMSYKVYRFLENQMNTPENWLVLTEAATDTFFVDNSWGTADKGTYYYAVEAVYDSGIESYKRKSNLVGKDMRTDFAVNITLPEKMKLSGTSVKLTRLNEYKDEVFVLENIVNSAVQIQNIWNDNYRLEISHPNCIATIENIVLDKTQVTHSVIMEAIPMEPVNLDVTIAGIGEATLTWDQALTDTTVIDDNTFETGFFFLPGEMGEFGNFYESDQVLVLKKVLVYGMEHSYSLPDNKVVLKVYDANKQYMGESKPFELAFNGWSEVALPNIKVDGNYYLMVSWDNFYLPTALLAIDADGETALANKAAVVNDHVNDFAEFGSVGGVAGAFLIRPEFYNTGMPATNNFLREEAISSHANLPVGTGRGGVSGVANTVKASKADIIEFNLYMNDLATPLFEGYVGNEFTFNNLDEETYSFGVSMVNEWGESPVATIEYTYTAPSNDATLKSITIDGEKLSSFDPAVFNYTVGVPENTTEFPLVAAEVNHSGANVSIENNQTDYVNIKVLAEDGEAEMNYAILFSPETGIDPLNAYQIGLYPNPAKSMITIDNAKGNTLRIYNVIGNMISQQELDSDNESVNVSGLDSGIYYFHISNKQGNTKVRKVTINN